MPGLTRRPGANREAKITYLHGPVVTPPPAVSVVVPCRNERDHVATCVRSITGQLPPAGGFEVIVVDGMSDDGTREILDRLCAEDRRLRVIDNLDRITPSGMNRGIEQARGSYVAIMGAHNRYARDYLRRSIEVLERTGADNVGGAMICQPTSRFERAVAAAHHSRFLAGGARWHDPAYEGPADTVFGGVYRREVFERIGLFDEELVRNQDDELNLRLTRAGGRIWQSPVIRSWYQPRGSLRAVFKQYAQYGYWKVRVIRRHGRPASLRHLMPACLVLSVAALAAMSAIWPQALLALFALLAAYLCATAAASILSVGRTAPQLFPLVCLVAAASHVAYGLGFLWGISDTVILRQAPSSTFTRLTRTQRP